MKQVVYGIVYQTPQAQGHFTPPHPVGTVDRSKVIICLISPAND